MSKAQKIIKYLALALAIFLIVSIFSSILGFVSLLSNFFTDDETVDFSQSTEYIVESDVSVLDIDLSASVLEIKQGEKLSVKSNHEHLKILENDFELKLQETKRLFNSTDTAYTVTLYIPQDYEFSVVDISTGAGVVNISDIKTMTLNLELGAGEAKLDKVLVNAETDIDGGAGKLTITNSELAFLDLDIGVGDTDISAVIGGESDIDCGVGQTKLELLKKPVIIDSDIVTEYKIEVDKGIGNVKINGENVKDGQIFGSGENTVDISCGIGDVDITVSN